MKVEVAVPNKPTVSVDVKQHSTNNACVLVSVVISVNSVLTSDTQPPTTDGITTTKSLLDPHTAGRNQMWDKYYVLSSSTPPPPPPNLSKDYTNKKPTEF